MVDYLESLDDFLEWKNLFNEVVDLVNTIGTSSSLTTTDKSSLVAAINELVDKIGSLSSLTTTDKTSIVNAINELVTAIDGLTIGSDVQAYSVLLQSISSLASLPANRLIYTSATNTFSASTITNYALTLLDDSDASTARTTLGLGSLAVLNTINNSNWSGTDLAVTNGGSGASTAPDARTNFGISYGKIALMSQAFN